MYQPSHQRHLNIDRGTANITRLLFTACKEFIHEVCPSMRNGKPCTLADDYMPFFEKNLSLLSSNRMLHDSFDTMVELPDILERCAARALFCGVEALIKDIDTFRLAKNLSEASFIQATLRLSKAAYGGWYQLFDLLSTSREIWDAKRQVFTPDPDEAEAFAVIIRQSLHCIDARRMTHFLLDDEDEDCDDPGIFEGFPSTEEVRSGEADLVLEDHFERLRKQLHGCANSLMQGRMSKEEFDILLKGEGVIASALLYEAYGRLMQSRAGLKKLGSSNPQIQEFGTRLKELIKLHVAGSELTDGRFYERFNP